MFWKIWWFLSWIRVRSMRIHIPGKNYKTVCYTIHMLLFVLHFWFHFLFDTIKNLLFKFSWWKFEPNLLPTSCAMQCNQSINDSWMKYRIRKKATSKFMITLIKYLYIIKYEVLHVRISFFFNYYYQVMKIELMSLDKIFWEIKF